MTPPSTCICTFILWTATRHRTGAQVPDVDPESETAIPTGVPQARRRHATERRVAARIGGGEEGKLSESGLDDGYLEVYFKQRMISPRGCPATR